jgi:hypothetical protein
MCFLAYLAVAYALEEGVPGLSITPLLAGGTPGDRCDEMRLQFQGVKATAPSAQSSRRAGSTCIMPSTSTSYVSRGGIPRSA